MLDKRLKSNIERQKNIKINKKAFLRQARINRQKGKNGEI